MDKRAALKLNIDEAKFLEVVDREGDREIGVGFVVTADRRAALVEAARTAAEKVYGTQFFNVEIAAAIAVVLEEAAKVAENRNWEKPMMDYDEVPDAIAAAIRAQGGEHV